MGNGHCVQRGKMRQVTRRGGVTFCSRQSPVIGQWQRRSPELQNGVLLAAGGVVCGDVHHPALTPNQVIALSVNVQRFPHGLPCRRAHRPVGEEVQIMVPRATVRWLLKGFAVLCSNERLLDNLTAGLQIHLCIVQLFRVQTAAMRSKLLTIHWCWQLGWVLCSLMPCSKAHAEPPTHLL